MADQLPDHIYQDGLHVIEQAIQGLKETNLGIVKAASNQTIHNSSVFQDTYSVNIAIVTYAISQILEARQAKSKPFDTQQYIHLLTELKSAVISRKAHAFNRCLARIFRSIKNDENKFPEFVRHVKTAARIEKSARMIDHGISVGQAAQVTGVTQWQMYSYLGKTKVADDGSDSISNMKKRLSYAMQLFTRK